MNWRGQVGDRGKRTREGPPDSLYTQSNLLRVKGLLLEALCEPPQHLARERAQDVDRFEGLQSARLLIAPLCHGRRSKDETPIKNVG